MQTVLRRRLGALWSEPDAGTERVLSDGPEDAAVEVDAVMTDSADVNASQLPKVRPIQMGELLRKFISRRLLALGAFNISRLMHASRQLGAATAGGAEARATSQQLVYDEWSAGGLPGPFARIKVDENSCFGLLEWQGIREAARQALPHHSAVAAWKHLEASHVEQEGVRG